MPLIFTLLLCGALYYGLMVILDLIIMAVCGVFKYEKDFIYRAVAFIICILLSYLSFRLC